MNEPIKTLIFFALAVILVGAAILNRPVVHEMKMEEMVGKALFPKFTDPLAVKKLEIVRRNAAGDQDDFRIVEVDGVWSIPSHDNYPADAKDQMGKVAEALYDLKVLEVVSLPDDGDVTSQQTMYGVVDPTAENASLGEGIGVKVSLGGAGDENFADLIVGKAVDVKEKKNPEDPDEAAKLRYVRVANQQPVYVVEVDPSRFSTSFDQWIEKNLLGISTLDIKEVYVDEYSLKINLEMTQRGPREVIAPTFSGDMTFGYNGSSAGEEKWNLKKWMGFRGRSYEYYERKMKPEEELNTETLDGMVSALNDLKIVSVTKKPSALATTIRSGKPFTELAPGEAPDPSLKKAGFYLVPMPDLKGGTKSEKVQLLSNEGDIQLRMKDGIRYHLRFGDLTGTESEIKEEKKEDTAKPGMEPAMGANRYLFITADFDASIVPATDIKPVPEVSAKEENKEEFAKQKTEKEQIEKSNQREKERYEKAVEDGKKRAEKLTDRFADWYYVIPEDVYKKIHLTTNNVFREKKKEEEHADHDHADHEPAEKQDAASKLPSLPGMDGLIKVPGSEEKPTVEEPKKEELKSAAEEPKKEEPKPAAEEPKKEEPKSEAPKENDKEKPFDPYGGENPSK